MKPEKKRLTRFKHNPQPMEKVCGWLRENHPDLADAVEIDRDWVWLANVNLRDKPTVRQSLLGFGFTWKRSGEHQLKSGRTATWSHSCNKPLPFTQRKKKNNGHQGGVPTDETDALIADAQALLASL